MIKKLEKPIKLILEQYQCEHCHTKFYINEDDNPSDWINCPLCDGGTAQKIRKFDVDINGIGEY